MALDLAAFKPSIATTPLELQTGYLRPVESKKHLSGNLFLYLEGSHLRDFFLFCETIYYIYRK